MVGRCEVGVVGGEGIGSGGGGGGGAWFIGITDIGTWGRGARASGSDRVGGRGGGG
jgi:hypothetical protein